ncbi:MAG: cytochrome c biogenesis protein CcdA [Clostridiaceae bacterium]|nr:cytochrome c biogenesis protein CcdA [Clostridiaceae bacterium]
MLPYVLTFAEGILTFISPCILPMLPVYFMYLAGTPDMEDSRAARASPAAAAPTDGHVSRRPSLLIINSLGFVAGFTLVFVILGALAATLGGFFENNRDLLQKISGVVMVLFGLNFTGILNIGFLNREKRFQIKTGNLKFTGSLLFGIVFGFGWSPCLGTFLGSALVLAGNSDTVVQGILLLLIYSLGLAIPFVVSAAIFDSVKGLFTWLKKNSRIISIISGILLIAAGILVFTGYLRYLV